RRLRGIKAQGYQGSGVSRLRGIKAQGYQGSGVLQQPLRLLTVFGDTRLTCCGNTPQLTMPITDKIKTRISAQRPRASKRTRGAKLRLSKSPRDA
ncbi:MAG: hypothetical protein VX694_02475, partial [Planctomycetota bacterium]|nr:hypothetical protein [Planctomycetota bacterium]